MFCIDFQFLNPSCKELIWGVDDLLNVIGFLTFWGHFVSQIIDFCIWLFVLLLLFLSALINFCEFEFQSLLPSTVFGVECHLIWTNVDLKRLIEKHAKFYHDFPFFPREHCRKTIVPCRIQRLKLYEDSYQLHALK